MYIDLHCDTITVLNKHQQSLWDNEMMVSLKKGKTSTNGFKPMPFTFRTRCAGSQQLRFMRTVYGIFTVRYRKIPSILSGSAAVRIWNALFVRKNPAEFWR